MSFIGNTRRRQRGVKGGGIGCMGLLGLLLLSGMIGKCTREPENVPAPKPHPNLRFVRAVWKKNVIQPKDNNNKLSGGWLFVNGKPYPGEALEVTIRNDGDNGEYTYSICANMFDKGGLMIETVCNGDPPVVPAKSERTFTVYTGPMRQRAMRNKVESITMEITGLYYDYNAHPEGHRSTSASIDVGKH